MEKLFLTQSLNTEGIVAVRFFVGGRPRVVTIDADVPYQTSRMLMFAQTSEDYGSWIPLLEKAYAKLAGNYEFTARGWMSESMRIFTAAPSTQINIRRTDPMKLWNELEEA